MTTDLSPTNKDVENPENPSLEPIEEHVKPTRRSGKLLHKCLCEVKIFSMHGREIRTLMKSQRM